MPKSTKLEIPLTPELAKQLVFDHWSFLGKLSRKRYQDNDNLADEALDYVLDKLEANDWQRVRSWEGLGKFATFLATLTSRLLTDFSRAKFGHQRKPTWMSELKDPLWDRAYRLLMVEKYERREAIELLLVCEPSREQWFIEEVVMTIFQKCHRQHQSKEQNVSIDQVEEQSAFGSAPDEELSIKEKEIMEAIQYYLFSGSETDESVDPRVQELLSRLNQHLDLNDEDRLILRLRYEDGVKLKDIVKLLKLEGDPYKRINKLINHLKQACEKAGLARG